MIKAILFFFSLLFSILTLVDFVISIAAALKTGKPQQYDGMKRIIWIFITCIFWTLFYAM